jgi:hypothetical protein
MPLKRDQETHFKLLFHLAALNSTGKVFLPLLVPNLCQAPDFQAGQIFVIGIF